MGKGAIPTTTLSWKNTKEDLELRAWLYTHSDRSAIIKDCLRRKMNDEKEREEKLKQLYKN